MADKKRDYVLIDFTGEKALKKHLDKLRKEKKYKYLSTYIRDFCKHHSQFKSEEKPLNV